VSDTSPTPTYVPAALSTSEKEELENIKKYFDRPKEVEFFEKIGAALHH
jgi:hypothetical protein